MDSRSPGASGVPPGALFPGRDFSTNTASLINDFLDDPTFIQGLSETELGGPLAPAAPIAPDPVPPGPGALALAPGNGLVVAEPMPAGSWRLVVMDHKVHCDAVHCQGPQQLQKRRKCEFATVSNLRQFNISVELQDANGAVVRDHEAVKLSAAVVYENGDAISLRQNEQPFEESCQVEARPPRPRRGLLHLAAGDAGAPPPPPPPRVLTDKHQKRLFRIQISAPEQPALWVQTIPMRSVVKLPCMRRDRKAGDGPDGGIFFNPPVDPVCPVTPPTPSALAALKEELKEELKAELKAELKEELREELLAELKAEIATQMGAQAVAAAAARQAAPAAAPLAPFKVMSAKMEELGLDDGLPPAGRSLPLDRQLPPSRHASDRLPAQDAQRRCVVAPAAVNAAAAAAVAAANAAANECPRPP
ncbi:hypothetical protein EMIHUDRAFT_438977 [Emiliania huxleyi CCMP1516]|uniref:Uncharacterized protein n=2 Tax=Emiliania huxleyi TaxID=2903 RepID=A0A0D3I341_EMIH1|nr:hypothetical protein EMIHUDRAFT_438977 [Emiliania huxleyi CCMP1516]EOD05676.1 hypothetical protein EMIHUDRAFT_438977 [Emiliania huxleyi CCMP1516]|eukprot:XP_005758105.1 hypothetical protein EMIHUDRAFT_438977 [Emiliania huxleyi CCMP1516]